MRDCCCDAGAKRELERRGRLGGREAGAARDRPGDQRRMMSTLLFTRTVVPGLLHSLAGVRAGRAKARLYMPIGPVCVFILRLAVSPRAGNEDLSLA